ncbi:hypothetical protein CO613_04500 [Lysobacteraceae bacterium NML07-0707]|nr:hypothetical protein CO613_04500 [Xanthomonadaceae bacterium NML07-0707]
MWLFFRAALTDFVSRLFGKHHVGHTTLLVIDLDMVVAHGYKAGSIREFLTKIDSFDSSGGGVGKFNQCYWTTGNAC